MQVDQLENWNLKLIVRPMAVNTNYHVTFRTKATLNIYDVFPVQQADAENALFSSLVLDNGEITQVLYLSMQNLSSFIPGIYIAFFHPKREESLTVAFIHYSYLLV